MRKCKFDLKLPVMGLNFDKYKVITLGDKYAKIIDIDNQEGVYGFVLMSKHKRYDFRMEIESIWEFKKRTFSLKQVTLEIETFDIVQEVYELPESHINTLQKWYDERT